MADGGVRFCSGGVSMETAAAVWVSQRSSEPELHFQKMLGGGSQGWEGARLPGDVGNVLVGTVAPTAFANSLLW